MKRMTDERLELLTVETWQELYKEAKRAREAEVRLEGAFIHGYEKGIKNNPNEDEWRALEKENAELKELVHRGINNWTKLYKQYKELKNDSHRND